MATAKALIKSVVCLASLCLCFRYLGGFSWPQTAVLAGLGAVGYGLYAEINAQRRVEKAFSPFRVSIRPNWHQLLSDFKLIASREEWHRLCERAEKVPASQYSVFRNGITFTVIHPPSDGLLPGLTYWDDRKCFLTRVDISQSIMPVEDEYTIGGLEKQHPYFSHPAWALLPEVYFRLGFGGYELGLEVQIDWWKDLCESGEMGELAKVKQDRDHPCGTTRLAVATLPLSEFGFYYTKVNYDQSEKLRAAMDKQLEANGWKRKGEYDPEIRSPWSHVEHKYFTVSYRDV